MSLPAAAPGERLAAVAIDTICGAALGLTGYAAITGSRQLSQIVSMLVLTASIVVGAGAWEAAFLAVWRSTPGKRLIGVSVVMRDGSPLTRRAALQRALVGRLLLEHGLCLAGGAGLVGYLSGLGGARLAWHDRIADTRVVRVRPGVSRPEPVLQPAYTPVAVLSREGLEYGSWLERAGALILDWAFVTTIVGTIAGPVLLVTHVVRIDNNGGSHAPNWVGFLIVAMVVVVWAAYTTIAIWLRETTIGKHAVGLVVRQADGSRVGAGRVLLRELAGRLLLVNVIAGLGPLVDMLLPLVDSQRQALHDHIASTIVVRAAPRRRGA